MLPALDGLSRTYFIELELAAADGKAISRNVYWLSTQTDELDWEHSTWYLTPVTRYADLTPLQSLPTATSEVRATLQHEGAEDIATVTLTVPPSAAAVALFQHVSIRRSAGGEPLLPILWSDNDVTLWPGESLTLTARFRHARCDGASGRSEWVECSDRGPSRSPSRAGRPLRRTIPWIQPDARDGGAHGRVRTSYHPLSLIRAVDTLDIIDPQERVPMPAHPTPRSQPGSSTSFPGCRARAARFSPPS